MKNVAALLIPVFALPAPVLADGYCRHASYAPTYSAPVYHAPYYPSYDLPHYSNDYAIVVGRAFPVYVPLGSYTSVSDEQRDYLKVKNATRDGFIEAWQITNSQGGGPVSPPAPPGPGPVPPLAAAPKAIPGAAGGAPRFTSLQAILTGRCASCHNPKEPKRVDLSGPVEGMPPALLGYCQTKVTSGAMPRNGELPQAEFDLLTAEIEKRLAAELAKAVK